MTGLTVGALLGAGLFCIWWSFWERPEQPVRSHRLRTRLEETLGDALTQAGLTGIRPLNLLASCLAVAVVATALFFGLTRVLPVAVCFGAIVGYAPYAMVAARARRRRVALRDLWPDAVDNITSAVRAGLSLPEALAQLADRGPEELRPAFAAFAHDYRTTGRFHDCLDRLKDSLADPVGDRLVESLRIAREVGGSDLGRLLRTLSSFLREDAHTRAELETRQGWTVNAARLACAAPWLVLAMLATRGESLQAYSTPGGAFVLLFGAGVSVLAYRLMMRLGRLPEDARVLR